MKGRSQWLSTGQPMHLDLCQAIAQILYSEMVPISLSKRAQELLSAVRDDFSWIEADKTTLIVDGNGNGNALWWIFAGKLFNSAMAESLASECEKIATDNLGITFTKVIDNDELFKKIRMVLSGSEDDVLVSLEGDFIEELKFSECLPQEVIDRILNKRYSAVDEFRLISEFEVIKLHDVNFNHVL